MTIKEFKKVARILKELYKELDNQAIIEGIDFTSDAYKELQDKLRKNTLSKLGYTIEEYRQAKEESESIRTKKIQDRVEETNKTLSDLDKKIEDMVGDIKIPSLDDIKNIATAIAKEHIKPPQITNQIIKETTHEKIIEKPQILETVRVEKKIEKYNDKKLRNELDKEIKLLYEKIDGLSPELETFKDGLRKEVDSLKESLNVMEMPDFRKLAMGLQAQIEEVKVANGDMLKSTYDPAGGNKQVAFKDELTPVQNFELELARKATGNSYMEYTEVGGNITQVNYWTDSGKGTKLFTKDITYSGSNPTIVVTKDEISGKILTTTIAYSGSDITSVTKIIS